jgi:hypothetical protein
MQKPEEATVPGQGQTEQENEPTPGPGRSAGEDEPIGKEEENKDGEERYAKPSTGEAAKSAEKEEKKPQEAETPADKGKGVENDERPAGEDDGEEDEGEYDDDELEDDEEEGEEGEEEGEYYDDDDEEYDEEYDEEDVPDMDYNEDSISEEEPPRSQGGPPPPQQQQQQQKQQQQQPQKPNLERQLSRRQTNRPSWLDDGESPSGYRRNDRMTAPSGKPMSPNDQWVQQQQQQGGKKGDGKNPLKLRLDLNLDIEIELKAKIHGDLTLALLYVSLLFFQLFSGLVLGGVGGLLQPDPTFFSIQLRFGEGAPKRSVESPASTNLPLHFPLPPEDSGDRLLQDCQRCND